MPARYTLAELNALAEAPFVDALGAVYEHSAWVARRVVGQRPFADVTALHEAMRAAVQAATQDEQLKLLRAHPRLAGRAAREGELSDASLREQRGAGLTALDDAQMARVARLNAAYADRFGFPFIIAVRAHTRDQILEHWVRRLANDPQSERATALDEVHTIARLRLAELVDD